MHAGVKRINPRGRVPACLAGPAKETFDNDTLASHALFMTDAACNETGCQLHACLLAWSNVVEAPEVGIIDGTRVTPFSLRSECLACVRQ